MSLLSLRGESPSRMTLFVSQIPPQTPVTDHQAPSTEFRRTVSVELTPPPPGILDGYVEIEESDAVLKVLRKVQDECGLGFQVRFGDTHTEVVSTCDLVVNTSQGNKFSSRNA
jgi:hypothetical protein